MPEKLEDRTVLVPSLSIVDATFAEGNPFNQDYLIQVNFSEAATVPFTIFFGRQDGTATSVGAFKDYSGVDGFFNVMPGLTAAATTASIFGDVTPEDDEYFFAKITGVSPASAATVADNTAIIAIQNDDGPVPTLGISVLRPNDGDNNPQYPLDPNPPCSCTCIGGTRAPQARLPDNARLEYSNRAANPSLTHVLEATIGPIAGPPSSASP